MPALAFARPPGPVLRPPGPLGNHVRQGAGLPHTPPRTGDEEVRQAARPQHAASGNRDPAADVEGRHSPRMARPPSRSFRTVSGITENLASRLVLSRGIQEAL